MKALTLCQPYATLIALGEKTFETRGYDTRYRGPLAIHAGRTLSYIGGKRGLRSTCAREPFRRVLTEAGLADPADLLLGVVIAVVDLVETFRSEGEPPPGAPETEVAFGDFSEGRYMWEMHNVRRLPEPLPACGHQRLWNPPASVSLSARRQVADLVL